MNRSQDSIEKVEAEMQAWQKEKNNKNCKINWQLTTQDPRIKPKPFYLTLQ